jgi:hypothetical protein
MPVWRSLVRRFDAALLRHVALAMLACARFWFQLWFRLRRARLIGEDRTCPRRPSASAGSARDDGLAASDPRKVTRRPRWVPRMRIARRRAPIQPGRR